MSKFLVFVFNAQHTHAIQAWNKSMVSSVCNNKWSNDLLNWTRGGFIASTLPPYPPMALLNCCEWSTDRMTDWATHIYLLLRPPIKSEHRTATLSSPKDESVIRLRWKALVVFVGLGTHQITAAMLNSTHPPSGPRRDIPPLNMHSRKSAHACISSITLIHAHLTVCAHVSERHTHTHMHTEPNMPAHIKENKH